MKRMLFVVAALISAAQVHARSPMKIDQRLSYRLSPKANLAGAGVTNIFVTNKGIVVGQECRPIFPNPCKTTRVKVLSRNEMNVIETLIDDARDGEIIVKSNGVHCMALGSHKKTLTADNGKVFLLESDVVCPASRKVNTSGAAEKLIKKLSGFYADYLKKIAVQ